jgi:hypothetical protein
MQSRFALPALALDAFARIAFSNRRGLPISDRLAGQMSVLSPVYRRWLVDDLGSQHQSLIVEVMA